MANRIVAVISNRIVAVISNRIVAVISGQGMVSRGVHHRSCFSQAGATG
ncbi:MAG: hypothetical protein M1420_01850 [Actinobacteria bacterium]|nr:hypothetical protein [Actinomycetota bacterium]